MALKPATDKQRNNWPTIYLKQYFQFEKNVPVRFEPKTFAILGILITSRRLAEKAKKIEYIIKQGRDESRRPDES